MRRDRPIPRRHPLGAVTLATLVVALALLVPAGAQAGVPRTFFGITAVVPSQQDFQRMGKVGLGAFRFGLNWRGVQPTRHGGFHWGEADGNVRSAAENGLQPTPLAFGTPRYVSKSGKIVPPTDSKEDRKLWQRFLAAAARRYGPGGQFWAENPTVPARPVRQWIIWNEENALPYWSPRPNAREFASLVKISDDAISSVDPAAKIVLGGMYGYPRDSRSIPAKKFLQQLYRVPGIERHFDAVSLHPYGSGVSTVRKQIEQARSAMRRAGDGNADIVIGELGWASKGPKRSPEVVGAKGQANRIRDAMKMLIANRGRWNIASAYVYLWRDFTYETSCLWCPHAGLVDKRGREKPALRALKRVIRANG